MFGLSVSVEFVWNEDSFHELAFSGPVVSAVQERAEQVYARARSLAPVGKRKHSGKKYRESLEIVRVDTKTRPRYRVQATAAHSNIVEAKYQTLRRAKNV